MHLDIAEVHRISERLGALDVNHKMLVSFITVQTDDRKICTEMGFMPHQLQPAIARLCSELHMAHLERWSWKAYIREATMLLVAPEKPAPPPAEEKQYRVTKKTLKEVESFGARYVKEGERTKDPILATIFLQVPLLLRFAISLCGRAEKAEELVQECLMRAFANLDTFQPGTNVKATVRAWLLTIVKNFYMMERRKLRRIVQDPEGIYAGTLRTLPAQFDTVELQEVQKALSHMSSEQRQVLVLAGLGYSYDEIASAANCTEGTIKSRLNRGRNRLSELTNGDLLPVAE